MLPRSTHKLGSSVRFASMPGAIRRKILLVESTVSSYQSPTTDELQISLHSWRQSGHRHEISSSHRGSANFITNSVWLIADRAAAETRNSLARLSTSAVAIPFCSSRD